MRKQLRLQGAGDGPRGQVLVITAAMMVVLIGLTGLAIDVSAAYLREREERVIADAAALAGGQDLQIPGSRALPGAAQYEQARNHALDVLVEQLGASSRPTSGACFTSAGCSLDGTPYEIAIQTPSPSCVDCTKERAIQVAIRQPSFGLSFARIFGHEEWTVSATSVAGMVHPRNYGIVTLRPPNPRTNGSDANEKNLFITGGSKVIVGNADVATNTNVLCSGTDSELDLEIDEDYRLYHFDPYQAWTEPSGYCTDPPPGEQMSSLVQIPPYDIPERTGTTPVYDNEDQAMGTDDTHADFDPGYETRCAAQQASVPDVYLELKTNYRVNDADNVTAKCFRPGVYRFRLDATTDREAYLLEPGVYFMDYGGRVASTLIGGYEAGKPGVALVFKEAKNQSGDPGQFTTNTNTSLLALNYGTAYCPGTTCSGSWATAADGPQGKVETPAPQSSLITTVVVPDPTCEIVEPEPNACKSNQNQTLKLTGGGNIFLAGVQFAPTDNATLTGNSGQDSAVGAFWAYTLEFTGGSLFKLEAATPEKHGILRLDPACSPTVDICNP